MPKAARRGLFQPRKTALMALGLGKNTLISQLRPVALSTIKKAVAPGSHRLPEKPGEEVRPLADA
jgi:hypothetical protein